MYYKLHTIPFLYQRHIQHRTQQDTTAKIMNAPAPASPMYTGRSLSTPSILSPREGLGVVLEVVSDSNTLVVGASVVIMNVDVIFGDVPSVVPLPALVAVPSVVLLPSVVLVPSVVSVPSVVLVPLVVVTPSASVVVSLVVAIIVVPLVVATQGMTCAQANTAKTSIHQERDELQQSILTFSYTASL